jgi:hypothetical protein
MKKTFEEKFPALSCHDRLLTWASLQLMGQM